MWAWPSTPPTGRARRGNDRPAPCCQLTVSGCAVCGNCRAVVRRIDFTPSPFDHTEANTTLSKWRLLAGDPQKDERWRHSIKGEPRGFAATVWRRNASCVVLSTILLTVAPRPLASSSCAQWCSRQSQPPREVPGNPVSRGQSPSSALQRRHLILSMRRSVDVRTQFHSRQAEMGERCVRTHRQEGGIPFLSHSPDTWLQHAFESQGSTSATSFWLAFRRQGKSAGGAA